MSAPRHHPETLTPSERAAMDALAEKHYPHRADAQKRGPSAPSCLVCCGDGLTTDHVFGGKEVEHDAPAPVFVCYCQIPVQSAQTAALTSRVGARDPQDPVELTREATTRVREMLDGAGYAPEFVGRWGDHKARDDLRWAEEWTHTDFPGDTFLIVGASERDRANTFRVFRSGTEGLTAAWCEILDRLSADFDLAAELEREG